MRNKNWHSFEFAATLPSGIDVTVRGKVTFAVDHHADCDADGTRGHYSCEVDDAVFTVIDDETDATVTLVGKDEEAVLDLVHNLNILNTQ